MLIRQYYDKSDIISSYLVRSSKLIIIESLRLKINVSGAKFNYIKSTIATENGG